MLERAEREAEEEGRVRLAIADVGSGRFRSVTASMADARRKYGIPDLSHLPDEQLVAEAEQIVARLREESPETYARAIAEGLV